MYMKSEKCYSLSHVQLLQPHGLQTMRLLYLWNSPSKNMGLDTIPISSRSSQPRDRSLVYCIAGGFFAVWAFRKTLCIYITAYLWRQMSMDLQLYPYHGYCKLCCYEHCNTCVSLNDVFLWIYAQKWDCMVTWQFYSQFLKESVYCSPQQLYKFTFPPRGYEGSLFAKSSPSFIVCSFFDDSHSDFCEMIPRAFDLHFSNNWIALEAQQYRICLQCRSCGLDPWVGKIPWRRGWLPILVFLPENSPDRGACALESSGWLRVRHDRADTALTIFSFLKLFLGRHGRIIFP